MSIHIEDLRNVASMSGYGVCDLAADDLEAMQVEIADHEKAYALLFKENAAKDAEIAALRIRIEKAEQALIRNGWTHQGGDAEWMCPVAPPRSFSHVFPLPRYIKPLP